MKSNLGTIPDAMARAIIERAEPAAARPLARLRAGRYYRAAELVDPALALTITLPLQTRSEANLRNWQGRCRRTKEARTVWLATAFRFRLPRPELPVVVKFTRLGGKKLDDDNLRQALKGLRDHIAEWLGVDDADDRVRWKYFQEPRGPIGVRVQIQPAIGVRGTKP